jgi:hypothetical protein
MGPRVYLIEDTPAADARKAYSGIHVGERRGQAGFRGGGPARGFHLRQRLADAEPHRGGPGAAAAESVAIRILDAGAAPGAAAVGADKQRISRDVRDHGAIHLTSGSLAPGNLAPDICANPLSSRSPRLTSRSIPNLS